MNWLELLSLLGLGGIIGGVIGSFFQSKFQHEKQLKEWEHELKKKRYLCINILLLTKIGIDKDLSFLKSNRPDITTQADLDKEIEMEFYNSFLFASADVIQALRMFRAQPSHTTYSAAAVAMRRDLWNKDISLTPIIHTLINDGKS